MARDTDPTLLRDAGVAFTVSAGYGAGLVQAASGLWHLNPKRFLGGLCLLFLAPILELGYMLGMELSEEWLAEEEEAEFMARYE